MKSIDTAQLFQEIENDLETLQLLTTRTLLELDAGATADLSRWLGEWTYLENFPEEKNEGPA